MPSGSCAMLQRCLRVSAPESSNYPHHDLEPSNVSSKQTLYKITSVTPGKSSRFHNEPRCRHVICGCDDLQLVWLKVPEMFTIFVNYPKYRRPAAGAVQQTCPRHFLPHAALPARLRGALCCRKSWPRYMDPTTRIVHVGAAWKDGPVWNVSYLRRAAKAFNPTAVGVASHESPGGEDGPPELQIPRHLNTAALREFQI